MPTCHNIEVIIMAPPKGKKIAGYVKLQVPAGSANPSPPIGPALGQRGLNIMEFCKAFNAQTQTMEKGVPCPVVITAYEDRTFTFVIKTPPNSYFVMKAAKIDKGAKTTGTQKVGKITQAQLREIAEKKMVDMNCTTIESAVAQLAGTARSMGVEVVA